MPNKKTPEEIIKKIRLGVLNGKTKYQVAKEMNLDYSLVFRHTADLPSINLKEPCIKGKTLDLLNQIIEHGYVHSSLQTLYHLRRIKKFIPVIQRAQSDGKAIYYLGDKNRIALKAMIEQKNSKIISYRDLTSISRVFGINLSIVEKRDLRNTKDRHVLPIIRRKDGGFLSSYKKNQMKLDDFNDETGFLGKNSSKREQKNHVFKNDSLLEKGDSLVDFCIRMYCVKN